MKRFAISNFGRGLSNDRYDGVKGQCAHCKQFDLLSYPKMLYPLRGMSDDTASTVIGNLTIASNGFLYGVGVDGSNPSNGKLWVRADNNTTASSTGSFGASSTWRALTTNQLSGATVNYDFLVQNPDAGQVRTLYWASTDVLVASDPLGASSAATQALTFASIGQGLLHPKDKIIYIPYRTTSAQQIATIAPNASAFGGYSSTSFTGLQFLYRAYCLSFFGDFLAIPQASPNGIGVNGSIVGLWDRNTSTSTFTEIIPWGAGSLQVLNNLNGVLVGVSTKSANYTGSFQDTDSVLIKAWAGGAEPTLIKEIKVPYIVGASPTVSHPTATINPRVNFIYNNRLYFSINLVPGDGTNPARYGLWSVGKNANGEWTVVQERVATNSNTETGVLAAAIAGDFVSMVHTAEGTLTYTINGQQTSVSYGATSVFESFVNDGMEEDDLPFKKKIYNLSVHTLPMPTGSQVVLKYRVDSSGADADWTTVRTFTTAGATVFETGAFVFTDGYDYQFRIESTGGAVVVSLAGRYDLHATNI